MSNFYIGDPHLFHNNILRHDNRPFTSSQEMNEALVTNWNSVVTPKDTVYILGDVSWSSDASRNRKILSSLNGRKILIRGNHDHPMKELRDCFDKVVDYLEINDCGVKVILFHYPILFWNGQFKDTVHLYAHVHNSQQWQLMESCLAKVRDTQKIPMRAFNVGCMLPWMNYTPRTLKQIIENQDF